MYLRRELNRERKDHPMEERREECERGEARKRAKLRKSEREREYKGQVDKERRYETRCACAQHGCIFNHPFQLPPPVQRSRLFSSSLVPRPLLDSVTGPFRERRVSAPFLSISFAFSSFRCAEVVKFLHLRLDND